ncbi:MAG TPA: glycerophosphodiester phosphodiesterase [Acidimicrobiia bacterium]
MPPITFAHRGGRAEAPENTLVAFARALEQGAGGLESDARLSGDREAVLVHGTHLRQGLRRLEVASTPAARLAEAGIPRLADLYTTLGGDFELSLDLKVPRAAQAILDAARGAGAVGRLWLCSNDLEVLDGVRAADPGVRLVHSMGRRRYGDTLEPHAAALSRQGVAALNLHEREWSAGLVALTHRFGLAAFAWDVQETRRLRALLAMHIDAVYSDHVDRMVATVGEWTAGGG